MMRKPYMKGQRWAVILAGGEGSRLSELTMSRFGEHRPKQYCAFLGERSMFEHTMDRATALVGRQRIVTVIGRGHSRFLGAALSSEICGFVVEQPRNCDTAPGIFLPLAYVLAYDAEATVNIFPSDHYIRPNELFLDCMDQAAYLAEHDESRLVLAAAVADEPQTEYGWIQPGHAVEGCVGEARTVRRFHEKPDAALARRFHAEGFLWNTFIMAAKAKSLWALGWEFEPVMMRRFEALRKAIGTQAEGHILSEIYEGMESANFSKKILELAASKTLVLPLRDVEWSDWGSPERIQETLDRRFVPQAGLPATAACAARGAGQALQAVR